MLSTVDKKNNSKAVLRKYLYLNSGRVPRRTLCRYLKLEVHNSIHVVFIMSAAAFTSSVSTTRNSEDLSQLFRG